MSVLPGQQVVCTGSLDQIQEENLRKKSHTELAVHAAHSTVVQFYYRRGLKLFSKLIQKPWIACASLLGQHGGVHWQPGSNSRRKSEEKVTH